MWAFQCPPYKIVRTNHHWRIHPRRCLPSSSRLRCCVACVKGCLRKTCRRPPSIKLSVSRNSKHHHRENLLVASLQGSPALAAVGLYEKIKTMLRRIGEGSYVPH